MIVSLVGAAFASSQASGNASLVDLADDPQGQRTEALLDLLRESTPTLSLRVRGDCMDPYLCDGDEILVERPSSYFPGDVVAFLADDGQFLVHRLLGYRWSQGGLALVTGADAATGWDDPVLPDRVFGKVVGRIEAHEPRDEQSQQPARVFRVGAFLRARALVRFARVAASRAARRLVPRRFSRKENDS